MFRVRRWVPIVAALALLGFVVEVGLARGSETRVGAEAYHAGPRAESVASSSLDWPSDADEMLALGVIAAILYGFRASGLARGAAPRPTTTSRNRRMS